jgi:uncharacterized protein
VLPRNSANSMTSVVCMSWLRSIKPVNVAKLALAYLFICLFMWAVQRHLMYRPATDIGSPESYGLTQCTDIRLQAEDGVHVQVWYRAAHTGFPTIIFFHGNGGNLAHRSPYFRALTDVGFGLLALDYRGYGKSEGSPSEEGFYRDARAAVNYAVHMQHIPPGEIVLYGESIGTGVAVQMATEYDAAALIVQSPFTSAENIAKDRYPWLPVHYLIRDRYDSLSKISRVQEPLLLLHGEDDTVVPVEEGKALFASANSPKQAVYFPSQGHNDLDMQQRVNALLAFSREHGLIP